VAPHSHTTYFVLLITAACFVVVVLDRTGAAPALRPVTTLLYASTVLLAGFALLLGVANVFLIHVHRIYSGRPDWVASIGLVVALFAVFVAGVVDPLGTTGPLVEWLFDSLIAPGQATLFALLAFFMAAAAYRYLRIGRPGGAWMLLGALLMLVVQVPAIAPLLAPAVQTRINWIVSQPLTAVMRGALLGGGLGLLVVGLRFLLGRTEA
jgi:hypothetical protein